MRAGELNQRVMLLRRDIGTASTSGLEVETFVEAGTAWARITPSTRASGGGESFNGIMRAGEETHQFRMRFRDALDETWRLIWRDEEYEIQRVVPGGRMLREWVDVMARASPAENPNR